MLTTKYLFIALFCVQKARNYFIKMSFSEFLSVAQIKRDENRTGVARKRERFLQFFARRRATFFFAPLNNCFGSTVRFALVLLTPGCTMSGFWNRRRKQETSRLKWIVCWVFSLISFNSPFKVLVFLSFFVFWLF